MQEEEYLAVMIYFNQMNFNAGTLFPGTIFPNDDFDSS